MYYNCELDLRNTSLATLRFHKLSRFVQPIYLPSTIRTIVIGEHFNRELNLQNIAELDTLQFYAKSKFNNPLHLPPTCKYVVLGRHFNQELQCDTISVLRFAKNSKFRNIVFLAQLQSKGIVIQHHLLAAFISNQMQSINGATDIIVSQNELYTLGPNIQLDNSDTILDNFISIISNMYDDVGEIYA
jgi:hypothetical protein